MTFEELAKKIRPVLKKIAYRLNGHFSYFNEDDLYQEALLKLWLDFRQGKLSDKTDSYILQGCYFHLKNYIRKSQERLNLCSIENLLTQDEEAMDLDEVLCLQDPESSFDKIHYSMLIEQIQNNGLTPREKEVFSFGLEGLTTREIGSRLGISHVRVIKLQAKIRQKCKKHMDY